MKKMKLYYGWLAALMLFLSAQGLQAQGDVAGDMAMFPTASHFALPDGSTLDAHDIVKGNTIMVVYFDPDCDHCQQQAKWINEKIESFNNTTVMFVSWGELDAIAEFPATYLPKAVGKKNFFFAKDDAYSIDDWFGESNVPTIYTYNRNWQRTHTFTEETEVSKILEFLK